MIQKGHFVMTTNFDFLIEYALLQLGVNKEDILCVITKDDFQRFPDPFMFRFSGTGTPIQGMGIVALRQVAQPGTTARRCCVCRTATGPAGHAGS